MKAHSLLSARPFRVLLSLFAVLVLVACGAAQNKRKWDKEYGEARVRNREVVEEKQNGASYWQDVRPILESRCVVCHGCYDSPCQLKLSAIEGIERGATKNEVYDPARLLAVQMTRLFEDAQTTEEWREKGFHPVLNERSNIAEVNIKGSVLYQMLALKKEHPLPQKKSLSGFDFSIDREQVCPTIEEIPQFKEEHPDWGMPYGLPGLSEEEFQVIVEWLKGGAVYAERPATPVSYQAEMAKWEKFLNAPGKKRRLISRYLFEHWFLAHLSFDDAKESEGEAQFFELVRSITPPGKPVQRISSRRPFDDPGVEEFSYRFIPLKTSILVKNHMTYSLTEKRMKRLRELFVTPKYEVKSLPDYESVKSANPFYTFLQLPVRSRYKFLLDEAQYTLDQFIKGPVCRGQTSLNVINDRFWVYFIDPHRTGNQAGADFLAKEIPLLDLPAGKESSALLVTNWLKYSGKQKKFLKAKMEAYNKHFKTAPPLDLDMIWNGDGENQNAALTVFRHQDSASVVKGLVGPPPKTSWVLTYEVLERIHYLLVAGFDVYGNVGHQVVTRLYMDFLRMEAEFTFLSFLPSNSRDAIRDKWYEGAEKEVAKYINSKEANFYGETGIEFKTMNPELEFYELSEAHLASVLSDSYELSPADGDGAQKSQAELQALVGGPVRFMPQMSFIEVLGEDGEKRHYTLLRDNSHSNILSLFSESDNRRPERDELVLVRGFLGAYPNSFFSLKEAEWSAFSGLIKGMKNRADYVRLRDRFGVRRTSPKFWAFSDSLHEANGLYDGQVGGLFDFNRLENR